MKKKAKKIQFQMSIRVCVCVCIKSIYAKHKHNYVGWKRAQNKPRQLNCWQKFFKSNEIRRHSLWWKLINNNNSSSSGKWKCVRWQQFTTTSWEIPCKDRRTEPIFQQIFTLSTFALAFLIYFILPICLIRPYFFSLICRFAFHFSSSGSIDCWRIRATAGGQILWSRFDHRIGVHCATCVHVVVHRILAARKPATQLWYDTRWH